MLKNDNQCWIHLPVDLTDPVLSEAAAEMRTSHQTIMAARLMVAHIANVEAANVSNVTVKQIVDAAKRATDAQRAAMLAAGPQ